MTRLEMMLEHVRAIYRVMTGGELPEGAPDGSSPSLDEVELRFAELEAIARARLAGLVPPFSFRPPLDVIGTDRELWLELGVPGVERGEVTVALRGDTLTVDGARLAERRTDGRVVLHAEMPRGPFRRVIRLPEAVSGPPRVQVERGIILIRLARAARAPRPSA